MRITLILALVVSAGAQAATLTVTGSGVAGETRAIVDVSTVKIEKTPGGVAVFTGDDVQWVSRAGEPAVPWQVVTVALPPDADLATLHAKLVRAVFAPVDGTWAVEPTPPMATWVGEQALVAWPPGADIVDGRDVAVYGTNALWPAAHLRILNAGRLRQWKLAQLAVPLVRYNPSSRMLMRLLDGDVVVECQTQALGAAEVSALADDIADRAVGRLAINHPAARTTYFQMATAGGMPGGRARGLPGYAIITTSAIQAASSELVNFAAHKAAQGFDVHVVTEGSWGGGTGDAAAENIRAWLQAHYLDDNLEFVLLIGDPSPTASDPTTAVPMKMLWPRFGVGDPQESPSDWYYADLTSNWDADGDGHYGEYYGDFGAIDRYAEVLVGRIPYYGIESDLDVILAKTIEYELEEPGSTDWRRNVLLPMKASDDWTAGYPLGERIRGEILVPRSWPSHRVYDDDYGLPQPPETTPCTVTTVTDVWSANPFGLVVWWTHGSPTVAVDIMTSYDTQYLNDDYPALAFQASCNNALPEDDDNLSYALLRHGGIATIGATRQSWYIQGESSFAGSASNAGMAYEFAYRVVAARLEASRALHSLKQRLIVSSSERWMNMLAFNIYGDPSVRILPSTPRRYVDASAAPGGDGTGWGTAYQDLRDGLDDAAAEVWVAAGTYRPDRGTGDSNRGFQLVSGTAVYGGFAGGETELDQRDPETNVTVLSGDLNGDDAVGFSNYEDNSSNVVIADNCDETAVLDGFVIRGGNARGSYPFNKGGGVNIFNAGPTIANCRIEANRSGTEGGGIFCRNGSPRFLHCAIARNSSEDDGGGATHQDSTPSYVGCTFVENGQHGSYAYGAAVRNYRADANFTRCTFADNRATGGGGAMYNSDCHPALSHCIFAGNVAEAGDGGAMFNNSSNALVYNCLYTANQANRGGAMANQGAAAGSSPVMINCTFYANTAVNDVGGIRSIQSSAPELTNCVLWANRDPGGTDESAQISGAYPVINYTCLQGWTGALGGTGNFDEDPLFCDPDGPDNISGTPDDNLRLLPGSPCVDGGDNAAVPESLVSDLDNETRIADGTVDCGAFEGPDQAFILSADDVAIDEGGSVGVTVALAQPPAELVIVTVERAWGDADLSVESGAALAFTPEDYDVPHPVVLAAAEDGDNLVGEAFFRVEGPDIAAAGINAREIENDPVTAVLYVDADATGDHHGGDWSNAYTQVRTALWIAREHAHVEEIRVAAGTYTPSATGDRSESFELRSGVKLLGGYAGVGSPDPDERDPGVHHTALSGDLAGNDTPGVIDATHGENSYHVLTAIGTDDATRVDGFTITGGYANAPEPDDDGGGIHADGGSFRLINCRVVANYAARDGAGIYNDYASPRIEDCHFEANVAGNDDANLGYGGGVFNHYGSDAVIERCTFVRNLAGYSGGGLATLGLVQTAYPVVTDCLFLNNESQNAGGISDARAETIYTNCAVIGNTGEYQGGGMYIYGRSNPTLVNCLFSGNVTDWQGGAVYGYATGEPWFINCTFAGNEGVQGHGGVYGVGGWSPALANCIVWGNVGDGVMDQAAQLDADPITVDYSCVQGWTGDLGGVGNHGDDPLFVDADGADDVLGTPDDDLHLSAGSPAVDAGDNDTVPGDVTTDLDGLSRYYDDPTVDPDPGHGTPPVVDMGAYERQPTAVPGDMDGDGDVDAADVPLFVNCLGGPGVPLDTGCGPAGMDGDGDCDLRDAAAFMRLF